MAFPNEVKATFPVIHDAAGKIAKRFDVYLIPANVIVDRHGKVVASIEGADLKAIEAAIAKATAEK